MSHKYQNLKNHKIPNNKSHKNIYKNKPTHFKTSNRPKQNARDNRQLRVIRQDRFRPVW